MTEDDVAFEAFEFLSYSAKSNSRGVSRDCDETRKSDIATIINDCKLNQGNQTLQSDDQKSELKLPLLDNLKKDGQTNPKIYKDYRERRHNFFFQSEPKGRKKLEIGVHKGKHGAGNPLIKTFNSERINLMPNKLDSDEKRSSSRFKYSISCENESCSMQRVASETPYIQILEKKGVLIKDIGTAKCKEENNHACTDQETEKILYDVVQEIKIGNDNVNQYLFYGGSKVKKDIRETKTQKNSISESEFTQLPPNRVEIFKNQDIKTLGDSITHFGLSYYLQALETSLEDVRRNKKSKEEHEEYFRGIDKEIQKLSFKYHPDKVKNRGGTEEELIIAQKEQTALNATRTVLKLLNAAFIEDIGTYHKFGFYTKLSITSMCNEDELRSQIYEVIFKFGVISRIKQQNIISEIRKFLTESKNCIKSYLDNLPEDFVKHRDLALRHLKFCVKGFKKLCAELEEVKEQCKSEKNSENVHSLIESMANDSKRDLRLLKDLKKTAKESLDGKYKFFCPREVLDPYFVLPFVSYINVILMCNVMVRGVPLLYKWYNHSELVPENEDLFYLVHPFFLASYCSGNKHHEKRVMDLMGKTKSIRDGIILQISKEEIELEFYKCMKAIVEFMDYKFKIENYNESMTTNLLVLDLKKCMTMMTEFEEKQEKLSKGIQEFQKKTAKMDEKYDKFDKMMMESEELNKEVKERLEKNRALSEKVSNALSDHL